MNALIHWLGRLRMLKSEWLIWRPFLRRTRDPERAQDELLRKILSRCKDTRFGREHGFTEIRTHADYATQVPIRHYEDLRPYIQEQEQNKTRDLLPEQPLMYARTSGTTGEPKLIPILKHSIKHYRLSQQIFSCCHSSEVPGLFDRKILGFVSPAIEGHLPTGTPYGSMSGLIYQSMSSLLRRKYLVPPEVFQCEDHELKYLLIATFALAEREISYVAAANPSSFLKIARVIQEQMERILSAIETGELPGVQQLETKVRGRLQSAFRANPTRAAELRHLFANGPQPITTAQLWPNLKAISCWREGSCRVLLPALRRFLPTDLPILEMGYLSSEFRGSLPVSSLGHREVPTFHENYFEFIERGAWEAGSRTTNTLADLEVGKAYYVIITTQAGLFRYFMNDLIVVDGFYHRTPTIKFLEKGTGVTNLTGEKLSESQVITAVQTLAQTADWFPDFFMLVADADQQAYCFYLETHETLQQDLAKELDTQLSALNLEYESKRKSGRLNPIALKLLRTGTGEIYKAHLLAGGQREAQFKFLRLQSRDKLHFNLDDYLITAE